MTSGLSFAYPSARSGGASVLSVGRCGTGRTECSFGFARAENADTHGQKMRLQRTSLWIPVGVESAAPPNSMLQCMHVHSRSFAYEHLYGRPAK